MKTQMKKQPKDLIKNCARILAHDLLRYSENGGDMQDITANKVYKFLENLDEQKTTKVSQSHIRQK